MDREINAKHRHLKKYAAIGVPLAMLLGAAVWGMSRVGTTVYHARPEGIIVEEVTRGEFNDYIRLQGKVESGAVVQVSALETGIVETRWVEEGAMVRQGDVLLTLRNPNLMQQILDSESQLAEKQNMLRDTELAMEKERLQLRQDLLATRTELNRLKRNADRQKALYDERLTPREDYLKSREDYDLAVEKYSLLTERLRQDSIYRSVQLGMMRESLDNMRRNFSLVRQRADNLNIRASHSGQLGMLNAEIGQSIASGTQVGQINILDNYKIAVTIDEHYIDRVTTGLSGRMERQGVGCDVMVSKVYPEVTDGTFRADMVFTGEQPGNVRVGQAAPVNLQLGEPVEAVMVPRGTFFQSTGGRWAYVLEPDGRSAIRRYIRIGRQNPRFYEVIEGLSPGERIITSSYSEYGEADRITIAAE